MRTGVSTAILAAMLGAVVVSADGPTTGPVIAPMDSPTTAPAGPPSPWASAVADEQLLVRNDLDVRPFLTKLNADHAKEIAKADLGGDASAAFLSYEFDRRGIGKPADLPAAATSLKVAADRGCPAAMLGMSNALHFAFEMPSSDAAALNWAQRAAAAGDSDGQVLVSSYVKQGVGIKADFDVAFKEATAAASAGNSNGVVEVALDTLQGQGIKLDTEAGLAELRQAAGMGNAHAMVLLGGFLQAGGTAIKQDRTAALMWVTKAANAGSISGLIQEAVCYNQGWGVAKDPAKSLELMKKAADTGDPGALMIYALEAETEKKITPEEATKLVERAVDDGSVDAIKALADRYGTGNGVTKDLAQAAKLYARAVEAGNGPSALALGLLYGSQPASAGNATAAAYWFRQGADLGNMPSIYLLARCYSTGAGVPVNLKLAMQLFEVAAANGNAPAQVSMGDALLAGNVLKADPKAALEWYGRAAAQGFAEANIKLAAMYLNGQGTPKDLQKAITAMQFGSRTRGQAMADLGVFLLQGQGVTKDVATGFELCKKSAELDDPNGLNNLASCYEDGIGTAKDQAKAAELYGKAAAKGLAPAMDSLATMYAEGRGVAKDPKAAVDWYRKATDGGSSLAAGHLAQMLVKGDGVPADPDGAIKAGERAVDLGDVSVMAKLYGEFESGSNGVAKDPARAMACSDKLAARGYQLTVKQATTGPTSGPTTGSAVR
jgi:TPR repeat protein